MALLNSLFSFPSDSYLLFHLLYIVRLKVSEHPTIADPGLLILVTGEIIKLQRIKDVLYNCVLQTLWQRFGDGTRTGATDRRQVSSVAARLIHISIHPR